MHTKAPCMLTHMVVNGRLTLNLLYCRLELDDTLLPVLYIVSQQIQVESTVYNPVGSAPSIDSKQALLKNRILPSLYFQCLILTHRPAMLLYFNTESLCF